MQQKIEILAKKYNQNLNEIKRTFINGVEMPLFKSTREEH